MSLPPTDLARKKRTMILVCSFLVLGAIPRRLAR